MKSMTIGSSLNRKPAHAKRSASHQIVAEWTIEEASTPRHLSVSFVVRSVSGDAVRSKTRRFLLAKESAAELIHELNEVLEVSAAVGSLADDASAFAADDEPTVFARQTDADDTDPMSNHFALGAYGLVGN
jgi:hypothetical protein